MDSFELFDQIQNEYITTNNVEDNIKSKNDSCCLHQNVVQESLESSASLCIDCGQIINKQISMGKEWRYYSGSNSSKYSSDPNRCQIRKDDDRNIFKDVENMGFSEDIVNDANHIYLQVTKKADNPKEQKIYRGKSRRAIIFACVFSAYKLSDNPQTCDSLIKVFKIDRKSGLNGLKHVNMNVPKRSPIRTTYITPVNLLENIMDMFQATKEQKSEVIDIYNNIKDKSSKLSRSRPQSVSAGLVYYWICLKKKNITIKEFSRKVNFSALTITKIAKEIEKKCGKEGIVI